MSTITFQPCGDRVESNQIALMLDRHPYTIKINTTAQHALSQLEEQLLHKPLTCPLCNRHVVQIIHDSIQHAKYPLTASTIRYLKISPMHVELHDKGNPEAKAPHTIHFRQIELANIVQQGLTSSDEGRTYRALATLSVDFNGLISEFGAVLGRILYWLPVSWKAAMFIKGMEKIRNENRPSIQWTLSDEHNQTIGLCSLTKVHNEDFELDSEIKNLKLYNIGVFLHSDYQRRGVVAAIANQLFARLCTLKVDMDALWIMTRPDNAGVNHIARKLHFSFIKQTDIKRTGLFSWLFPTATFNLYIKKTE